MKPYPFLMLIFFVINHLHASIPTLEIDHNSSGIELLNHAGIYIAPHNQTNTKEITRQPFVLNTNPILSLGFNPKHELWIKFRLKNSTQYPLERTIEYANAMTEEILFFDDNTTIIEGAWHIPLHRFSLNPIFHIQLAPLEEKTFYLKAHSTISTLIAQLILWKPDHFVHTEYQKKAYLLIFFTILFTLLLYNIFIYFFTKDRAYLYYIIYLFAVILNELSYAGMLQLYLLSPEGVKILTQYMILISAFLIISMLAFTREFLQTFQFKRLDLLLKSSLYLVPLFALLSCYIPLLHDHIVSLFLPLGGLVVFVAFYALFQGVKEARFYVMGWSIVIVALILTNLQTLGIIAIGESVKYSNDIAFIAETFLFSVALAHRIKLTNEKLNNFQAQEQQRLQKLVALKTQKLKASLEKEELLYRELNHRVKNNFQMILSLIKLQILQATAPSIKKELTTIRDRIHAIAHLYEMLQIDKDIATQVYFENIVQPIQQSFRQKVKINYDIQYTLPLDKLIYCGLILNELVTNSFKYAFEEEGEINISLYQKEERIYFVIKDNGRGYLPTHNHSQSLGLLIIQTLVEKQLLGKLHIKTTQGVENSISWDL